MADQFQDSRERVEELLAAATLLVRRGFLRAIADLRNDLRQEEIERLLATGRQAEILVRYRMVAERTAAAYQAAFLRAATSTSTEIGRQLGELTSFDVSVERVARGLREERARVVNDMVRAQALAVSAALSGAFRLGLGIEGQARAVRDSLGLTPRQVGALERYRELLGSSAAEALRRELRDEDLDPILERARDEERPLTEAQERRMSEAYRANTLLLGATTLAELEAQSAMNLGLTAALDQAVADELLDGETLIDRWNTARDERVRPSHRAMQGQERTHGEPFRSGDGNLLRFPGDPLAPASDTRRCRCVVTSRASAPVPLGVA